MLAGSSWTVSGAIIAARAVRATVQMLEDRPLLGFRLRRLQTVMPAAQEGHTITACPASFTLAPRRRLQQPPTCLPLLHPPLAVSALPTRRQVQARQAGNQIAPKRVLIDAPLRRKLCAKKPSWS